VAWPATLPTTLPMAAARLRASARKIRERLNDDGKNFFDYLASLPLPLAWRSLPLPLVVQLSRPHARAIYLRRKNFAINSHGFGRAGCLKTDKTRIF
jgi:hypothetical protein